LNKQDEREEERITQQIYKIRKYQGMNCIESLQNKMKAARA
jgi:hypothetical protein